MMRRKKEWRRKTQGEEGKATHQRNQIRRVLSPKAVAARWSRDSEQDCTVKD